MKLLIFLGLLTTALAQSKLRYIVIGNHGDNNDAKERVADAMNEWMEDNTVDFILTAGDNFYPDGVTSPDDPMFDTHWKDFYNHENLADLPWYITLGNRDHDEDLREWNQVFYSAGHKRYIIPELTHSFVAEARETTVQFVIIDTQSLRQNKNDREYMLKYLDDKLSHTHAFWKVVVGHHPAYSVGGHSGSSTIRNMIDPILIENDVHFYISGHDHNMQHLKHRDNNVDYIGSGSGSRPLFDIDDDNLAEEEARGVEVQNFSYSFGFAYIEMDEKRTRVTFVSDTGEELYFYEREADD